MALYDDLTAQLYYLHRDGRGNIRSATDGAANVVEACKKVLYV